MKGLTNFMFGVFLASLTATSFTWLPAVLSCLVFLLFWADDRSNRAAEKMSVPEPVDLTGVWAAITKLEESNEDMRSELNALNLRAGLTGK